jgi:hypothetical protein
LLSAQRNKARGQRDARACAAAVACHTRSVIVSASFQPSSTAIAAHAAHAPVAAHAAHAELIVLLFAIHCAEGGRVAERLYVPLIVVDDARKLIERLHLGVRVCPRIHEDAARSVPYHPRRCTHTLRVL